MRQEYSNAEYRRWYVHSTPCVESAKSKVSLKSTGKYVIQELSKTKLMEHLVRRTLFFGVPVLALVGFSKILRTQ